ncbi:MAG: OmpA family protein [Vicingaceae bacterium]
MKYLWIILVFFSTLLSAQNDTITLYFEIGKFEASKAELKKLDLDLSSWTAVDIISYTDYLGTSKANLKLSMQRSREVRARLVQRGLNTEILGRVEGKGITGKTLQSKEGIRENRRTEVVFSKTIPNGNNKEALEEKRPINKEQKSLSTQLDDLGTGDKLILSNLQFVPGNHYLIPDERIGYQELLWALKKEENLKINIEGHICCDTEAEDGLDQATGLYNLSEARAKYIYDLLIEDGIDADRLSYEGFGRRNPIYPEERNEEEKQANRRVEITVLAR